VFGDRHGQDRRAATVIGVGLKAFVNVTSGALTASVRVAADAFDAPCVLVSALAGIVLSQLPGVALVTLTVIVQLAPAPTAPPVRATLGPPAVAEAVRFRTWSPRSAWSRS